MRSIPSRELREGRNAGTTPNGLPLELRARLEAHPARGTPDRFAEARHQTLFNTLRLLGELANSEAPERARLVEQLVDLMSLDLGWKHSSTTPALDRPPPGGLAPWQIHRVIAYMKERLDQEITLLDLAGAVRLSRFHFCTAFHRATGSTPHEMLRRLRVDAACRLLTSSNQSISEIALSVGFQTPSAFAARFRKAVGLTPREFRRSRRFLISPTTTNSDASLTSAP